jgi:hypothetical protein
MATSRAVRQVAGGERVWRELAFRDFGVCEPFGEETAPASTPEGDALEGARWRALHHDVHVQLCKDDDCLKVHGRTTLHDDTPYDARCPPDEMRALRARGVFCDGGVDENDPENWFGQVFELEGAGQRFYCSAASRDVHLVGCFAEGDVHCAWRADAARHARRRFMAAKCSLLAHVLERLSAQSSLAPEDQRDFDTILREARLLPPYDFTGWPHEELGSFFTHYVRQYRPDDPISQLFFDANSENSLFPRDAEWSVPDDGPNAIDALRRIAELHRKDQRLELRLSNYHDPLTHVEPLPEAEHRLFEYLEARQPDNEFVSFDVHNEVRARRERRPRSDARRRPGANFWICSRKTRRCTRFRTRSCAWTSASWTTSSSRRTGPSGARRGKERSTPRARSTMKTRDISRTVFFGKTSSTTPGAFTSPGEKRRFE